MKAQDKAGLPCRLRTALSARSNAVAARQNHIPCPAALSTSLREQLLRKMEGYAKLSSVISTDSEFAIYRRFGALNAQNLLYYQAELLGLEDDLNVIASQDRNSQDSEKREFAYNWAELSQAADGKNLQHEKFMKIRKTLREYSQRSTVRYNL